MLLIFIWVTRMLEITPWNQQLWGVGLFTEGRGKEPVIMSNGGTLAFG